MRDCMMLVDSPGEAQMHSIHADRRATTFATLLLTVALGGCGTSLDKSFRLAHGEVAMLRVDGDGASIDIYNAGPAEVELQVRTVTAGAAVTMGATVGPNLVWKRTLEGETMLRLTCDDATAAANMDLRVRGAKEIEFTPPSIDTSRE